MCTTKLHSLHWCVRETCLFCMYWPYRYVLVRERNNNWTCSGANKKCTRKVVAIVAWNFKIYWVSCGANKKGNGKSDIEAVVRLKKGYYSNLKTQIYCFVFRGCKIVVNLARLNCFYQDLEGFPSGRDTFISLVSSPVTFSTCRACESLKDIRRKCSLQDKKGCYCWQQYLLWCFTGSSFGMFQNQLFILLVHLHTTKLIPVHKELENCKYLL